MRIYNSHQLNTPTRPLVLYLPPTGVHLRSTHPVIPSILHSHPLVSINYRWNYIPSPLKLNSNSSPFTTIPNSHPFPTPLHDILHAYAWLTTQYIPSLTSSISNDPSQASQSPYQTPPPSPSSRSRSPNASGPRTKVPPKSIIVYGSRLGGTLATSLALTECKATKNVPFNIAGLIVRDGVFDWTRVATSLNPSQISTSSRPNESNYPTETQNWTLDTLYSLRGKLFATPETVFDSFASPALFFRTSGLAVPKSPYFPGCEPPGPVAEVDLAGLSLSEAEYAALTSAEFDSLSGREKEDVIKASEKKIEELQPDTSRSANVKFPPRDSGLKVPRSLFLSTGQEDKELREQTEKMAGLMRRSIILHEFKDRVMWDEDLDPQAAAWERVRFAGLGEGGEGEEEFVELFLEGID